MFNSNKVNEEKLDAEITRILELMKNEPVDSEEYILLSNRLKNLIDIQNSKEEKTDKLNKNTMALVAGNLAGILLVVNHERLNVVTSKAMSLLMKVK